MSTHAFISCGSFVAVLVTIASFLLRQQYLLKQDGTKEDLLLGVCVLSARGNQVQRAAIRNSWLQNISQERAGHNRTVVKFVLGKQACPLQLSDREDEFGCQEWTPQYLQDYKIDFETFEKSDSTFFGPTTHRLRIEVLHPVIIKRIGIQETIPLSQHPLVVSAFKEFEEEEFLSAQFSEKDAGITHRGFRYQPVEPVVLPKGAWLELTLSSDGDHADAPSLGQDSTLAGPHSTVRQEHHVHRNVGPNVLLVECVREDGTTMRPGNGSLNSLVSFMYAVADAASLSQHAEKRQSRDEERREELRQEESSLRKEMTEHGDLLLVDGVDVYRALPDKLLQCHSWFSTHFNAAHVLKTDDDTYLDLDRIVTLLSSEPLTGNTWWGNFRQEWMVERGGKWRERVYPPSVYPPFACGSGYVVSRPLHLWLADNAPRLHRFQGEDISMGIWLSPLAPQLLHDTRWQCFKLCQDHMLSMPDLTTTELASRWHNHLRCSSPCSPCASFVV